MPQVLGVRVRSGVQAAAPPLRTGMCHPAFGQGVLESPVTVPWLREAVCLLRGQSKLGKGEFVFQA